MGTIYRFTIGGKLLGLNEYTRLNRANRYAGARAKKDEEERVRLSIREHLPNVKICGKVSIHIAWYDNTRRDIDNIRFGAKFILDAMVREGTIEDDSKKFVTQITDTFPEDVKTPRIEVCIFSEED